MKLDTYFSSTRSSRQPEYRKGSSKTIVTSNTDETASILTQDALNEVDNNVNGFISIYEESSNPAFEIIEPSQSRDRRKTTYKNNDISVMFMADHAKKSRKPRKPRRIKSNSSKDGSKTVRDRSKHKEVDEEKSRKKGKGRKKVKGHNRYNSVQEQPIVHEMGISNSTDELSPEEDISNNSYGDPEDSSVDVRDNKLDLEKSRQIRKKKENRTAKNDTSLDKVLSLRSKAYQQQSGLKAKEIINRDVLLPNEVPLQVQNQSLPRRPDSPLQKVHRKSKSASRLAKRHTEYGCNECKTLSMETTGFENVECVCSNSRGGNHDCYLQLQFNEQVTNHKLQSVELILNHESISTKEPRKNLNKPWKKIITACRF